MVFYQSLSDSKFLQVSMTLLGILADLNDVLVWMVSAYPLIFNSSSPLTKLLGTVPTVPITIGTTSHLHVPCSCFLFLWQDPSSCFSFYFL